MAEEKEQQLQSEDINEMMQVRRDKMKAFADKGIAPFGHRYEVTHHAQDIRDHFDELVLTAGIVTWYP